jgi:hypothetical protein
MQLRCVWLGGVVTGHIQLGEVWQHGMCDCKGHEAVALQKQKHLGQSVKEEKFTHQTMLKAKQVEVGSSKSSMFNRAIVLSQVVVLYLSPVSIFFC